MSTRSFLDLPRKGGETRAHHLNGLKGAMNEVQLRIRRSSIHAGREAEIELTRLGFHNNLS